MGSPDQDPSDCIKKELKGKTLDVYFYMLDKDQPVGVREIQRALNFKSPGIAQYHIQRLFEWKLVGQDNYGMYYLLYKLTPRDFRRIFGRLVPKMLLYAVFFTNLLVTYAGLSFNILPNPQSFNIFAIGFGIAGATIFWFETVRAWKRRAF